MTPHHRSPQRRARLRPPQETRPPAPDEIRSFQGRLPDDDDPEGVMGVPAVFLAVAVLAILLVFVGFSLGRQAICATLHQLEIGAAEW